MDEQEQQNREQGFLKEQSAKAKGQLKDMMSKQAKGAIKKAVIAIVAAAVKILLPVIIATTILRSSTCRSKIHTRQS